jgi:hypothetical protein
MSENTPDPRLNGELLVVHPNSQLCCPNCGDPYGLHHERVTVKDRDGEDGAGIKVVVDNLAVAVGPTTEFAGRRNELQIEMWCEHCGPVGALSVEQWKGTTVLNWRPPADG